jgi:copper chaperone CopZ
MTGRASDVETTLRVTGMTCTMCVQHVTRAIEKVPGVTKAVVTLEPARAVVRHDPAVARTDDLVAAVRGAGYDATT